MATYERNADWEAAKLVMAVEALREAEQFREIMERTPVT